MDVFLTSRTLDHFRDLLESAAPDGTRWLALDAEGWLRAGDTGEKLEIRRVTPEIAWMTSDLFPSGPTRQFFGLVTRSSSLRWIQSSAAGFDAPVFAELLRRGVRLTASHIAGPPIADYVLRAALDHLQDADAWRAASAQHRWEPHETIEMASTRWLVIGLGAIGAEVAVRARACGAHVTGVRRSPRGSEPVDALARPDEVPGLLPESDVVVLATPATTATTRLVDDGFLSHMRPNALLVNVGRGALVDEAALLHSLDQGRPARAVLDVTSTEPLPPEDPLWGHPRVAITPHNSALGDGRHRRAAEVFAENLRRYTNGEPLLHEITLDDVAP